MRFRQDYIALLFMLSVSTANAQSPDCAAQLSTAIVRQDYARLAQAFEAAGGHAKAAISQLKALLTAIGGLQSSVNIPHLPDGKTYSIRIDGKPAKPGIHMSTGSSWQVQSQQQGELNLFLSLGREPNTCELEAISLFFPESAKEASVNILRRISTATQPDAK